MSEESLPKEVIRFIKTDTGLEEVREISSAAIRMFISQYYIKAMNIGYTIDELAERAGMDVEEFKSAVQCGSYEYVGILSRIAHALNFELVLELNANETDKEASQ